MLCIVPIALKTVLNFTQSVKYSSFSLNSRLQVLAVFFLERRQSFHYAQTCQLNHGQTYHGEVNSEWVPYDGVDEHTTFST